MSAEHKARNEQIIAGIAAGKTYQWAADTFGITRQRAHQIVEAHEQRKALAALGNHFIRPATGREVLA